MNAETNSVIDKIVDKLPAWMGINQEKINHISKGCGGEVLSWVIFNLGQFMLAKYLESIFNNIPSQYHWWIAGGIFAVSNLAGNYVHHKSLKKTGSTSNSCITAAYQAYPRSTLPALGLGFLKTWTVDQITNPNMWYAFTDPATLLQGNVMAQNIIGLSSLIVSNSLLHHVVNKQQS